MCVKCEMIVVCVLWLEFERCANVLLACDACCFWPWDCGLHVVLAVGLRSACSCFDELTVCSS